MRFLVVLSVALGPGPTADGWTGADKWRHLVASALTHATVYSVARAAGIEPARAQQVAGPVALGVGLAKELRDRRPGGSGFSGRDLVWDLAGTGLATVGAHQVR